VSGPGLVAGDVVLDALPCFSQGYEAPGVWQVAVVLVEEETQRYRPTKSYLSYLPVHGYSVPLRPSSCRMSLSAWWAGSPWSYSI
uniref:Uncharacterized protein n=1 Tax=Serinus canaria TaxID=9135 RepID=A0A8C9U7M3_SERCA